MVFMSVIWPRSSAQNLRLKKKSHHEICMTLSPGLPPVASFSTLSSLKDGTYRCENALTHSTENSEEKNRDVQAKISSGR